MDVRMSACWRLCPTHALMPDLEVRGRDEARCDRGSVSLLCSLGIVTVHWATHRDEWEFATAWRCDCIIAPAQATGRIAIRCVSQRSSDHFVYLRSQRSGV